MSALNAPIDYQNLEKDLHKALQADELYQLQNDAKIRAVEQGVPTYEHFRQMVNAAHLKPLDRADTKPKYEPLWNPIFNQYNVKSFDNSEYLAHSEKNINTNPKSSEFLKAWKMLENFTEKFAYVCSVRHLLQETIFRVEVPSSFLSELIEVCEQNLATENISSIIDIFTNISMCGRFHLSVSFMTEHEKAMCARLFKELFIRGKILDESLEDTLKMLAAKYELLL